MLFKNILAFRPSALDLTFAVKTFIAMMLALYIAFSLDLTYPMWAAGTVVIIAQPYAGMVSSKALYRLLGTFLGGTFAIFLTPRFIDMPILFTFILAIWVGFCLYISLLDRTPRSYMFMLAGYTTVMVACSSIYNIQSHSVFDMALSRILEISIAVICSAVVSAVIFPAHLGTQLQQRVKKLFADTRGVFAQIFNDTEYSTNYTQLLGAITRDTTDIHSLTVHLSFERGELRGMTKPIQELLHQQTMIVSNLVSMAERLLQLDQIDTSYRQELAGLHQHILDFIDQLHHIQDDQVNELPATFEQDFQKIYQHTLPEQKVIVDSFKMDVRHFIQNVISVRLLWQLIQQGNKRIPKTISAITTRYPSLHRDHGIAIRSSIAAGVATIVSFLIWIYSGWQAGYMMAQLSAVTACILATLDNPIPVLKLFIRGSIYSAVLTIFYAFVIMPEVSSFWQMALVLAPISIYLLSMMPNPLLMGLALPMMINFVMSLNLQNRYVMDAAMLIDSALAGVVAPIISILAIYFIRALSPDQSAQRLLQRHYRALRHSIDIPYGSDFRIHLRSMLDRIGILNTKLVQSESIKKSMNNALIEASAVVNLSRIAEFKQKDETLPEIKRALQQLQDILEKNFRYQEKNLQADVNLQQQALDKIREIEKMLEEEQNTEIEQRVKMSMNNIRSSILHCADLDTSESMLKEVPHG